jgi:hypothetical protein
MLHLPFPTASPASAFRDPKYALTGKNIPPILRAIKSNALSKDFGGSSSTRSCPCADLYTTKYAVSQVIGFIKGKSAIHIARNFTAHRKNFSGQHFRARGYYVSTMGKDEATVREYIKKQEQEDRRLDQLNMFEE